MSLIAHDQAPQSVVLNRLAVLAAQQAVDASRGWVVGHDPAAAELAHEQIAGECAEAGGRFRHAPRGVHGIGVLKTQEHAAVWLEYRNSAKPRAVYFVFLAGFELRIGDHQPPADF